MKDGFCRKRRGWRVCQRRRDVELRHDSGNSRGDIKYGAIQNVGVTPAHRGRGIGIGNDLRGAGRFSAGRPPRSTRK